jgi:hypothetical protein
MNNDTEDLSGTISSTLFEFSGTLSEGDSALSGDLANATLRGYSAYEVAVQNGYTGTETEWLDSLKGKQVVLRVNGTKLQYQYDGDIGWSDLTDLNEFAKSKHDYNSYLDFPTVPSSSISADFFIDKENNKIYRWDNDDLKYYCVGSDYGDISVISGGDFT